MRINQNLGKLDCSFHGQDNNGQIIDELKQINNESQELNKIESQFLNKNNKLYLLKSKPQSQEQQLMYTEKSDSKGSKPLKLSDIKSNITFQDELQSKDSQNFDQIQNYKLVNYEHPFQERDNKYPNSISKNSSVYIERTPDKFAQKVNNNLSNFTSSLKKRNQSSYCNQRDYQEGTSSTLEASQSQNGQREFKLSTKKREIVELKDEIDYLAQSLKSMNKIGRKQVLEENTPYKQLKTISKDSYQESPNFKQLQIEEQEIDKDILKNKDSKNVPQFLQKNIEQEELKTIELNQLNQSTIKKKKVDEIYNLKNLNESQTNVVKNVLNLKERTNIIDETKAEILLKKRLIKQLQLGLTQFKLKNDDFETSSNQLEDSVLQLSNYQVNNSFQNTNRNPILSNQQYKERQQTNQQNVSQQKNNNTKEIVIDLIENLSTDEINQIQQYVEDKISQKQSYKYQNNDTFTEEFCDKRQQMELPNQSGSKQNQLINKQIINENKYNNKSNQSNSTQKSQKKSQSTEQRSNNQNIQQQLQNNINKALYNERINSIARQKQQNQTILAEFQCQIDQFQNSLKKTIRKQNLNQNSSQKQFYETSNRKQKSNSLHYDNKTIGPTKINQNSSSIYLKNKDQNKKNQSQKRQINYQLDILQQEQNQLEQNHFKIGNLVQNEMDQQSFEFYNDKRGTSNQNIDNNCFDTFCRNDSISDFSIKQQQTTNNPILNQQIFDSQYNKEQNSKLNEKGIFQIDEINQNIYQHVQSPQFSESKTKYQNFSSQQKSYQVQNELTINDLRTSNPNFNSIENQFECKNNTTSKKQKNNDFQKNSKKIKDLLSESEQHNIFDKQPTSDQKLYRKPKSLEIQANHNQFMQSFLLSKRQQIETQDLIQRYSKLVDQIREKLKTREIEKKKQERNIIHKSPFRF